MWGIPSCVLSGSYTVSLGYMIGFRALEGLLEGFYTSVLQLVPPRRLQSAVMSSVL